MDQNLLAIKRKKSGYSQQQMAELLDYKDKSSYCLIENNKASITLEIAKKIKHVLRLTDQEFESIFFNEKVEETQTSKAI